MDSEDLKEVVRCEMLRADNLVLKVMKLTEENDRLKKAVADYVMNTGVKRPTWKLMRELKKENARLKKLLQRSVEREILG